LLTREVGLAQSEPTDRPQREPETVASTALR
jgi:hypothetical protein